MSAIQKTLIVIGSGIILLALVAFIMYPIFKAEPEVTVVADTTEITPANLVPLPPDQPVDSTAEEVVIEPLQGIAIAKNEASTRSEVERLTRLFVERFGSYSNFSDFRNISSMQGFMTASMKSYAETFIDDSVNTAPVSGYYGVTTNILGLNIESLNMERSATVNIIVQQEVQDGLDGQIIKSNRDGQVKLVYSGGEWLVDGLFYN